VPSPAVLQPLARAVVAQTTRASKRAGGQRTRFHATRSQAGTGARAPRGHHGRRQGPRRPAPCGRDGQGAGPHPGALPAHGRCAGPSGKRAHGSPTRAPIGSHGVSARCGPPVPGVAARCRLWVTRYRAPRRVPDGALGLGTDGHDPAPRAHTGSPRARVDGSHHERVPRLVSGGTARAAPFDLMSLGASGLAGPARAMESPSGSRATQGRWAHEG